MSRNSRTQEQRNAEPVHETYDWSEAGLLDTKKIPARQGYVQRWIRTHTKGTDDQSNVFNKYNAGWRPRSMSSVEQADFVPHIDFNGTDVIGIHGMVLMERPEGQAKSQSKHIRQRTDAMSMSVESNMLKAHDPNSGLTAPVMTNKSSVSKGRLVTADD